MTAQQTDKKVQLIEDILKIIVGEPIDLIEFKDLQKITFVKKWNNQPHIFRIMQLEWNDKFDFVVYERMSGKWEVLHIPTSRWFRVRDLLRKNFLQAEKLKKQ